MNDTPHSWTVDQPIVSAAMVKRGPDPRPPLAVDLDGTLVLSDTLHEGLMGYLRAEPKDMLALVRALLRGKAEFKRQVAAVVPLDPVLLPYNAAFLEFLRGERRSGRRIGLFSAADQSIVDAVADHLGIFDVACGSADGVNLSGTAKAAAIERAFGPVFAYAGDGMVDQPIFARAASVILVAPVARLKACLAPRTVIEAEFQSKPTQLAVWIKALRLQHWAKNALVFLAPVLAPPSFAVLMQTGVLFVLLGVVASATYLINDLIDLPSDRRHIHKRHRPLAAGTLKVRDGAVAAVLMIGLSLMLGVTFSYSIDFILICYLAITLSYSLCLKRVPMVDVSVLAGLFTLRVLAGSLMLQSPISPWLLTFSMLFFLSLAMIKRYAELERVIRTERDEGSSRGYTSKDIAILLASGMAAAMSAIVIFVFYLINDQYSRAIYTNPNVLWGIMPILLVWKLRLWHMTVHGRMSEDPVVFALHDRMSLTLGMVIAAILVISRM